MLPILSSNDVTSSQLKPAWPVGRSLSFALIPWYASRRYSSASLLISVGSFWPVDKDLPTGQAGFNCELVTSFDDSIGNINIISQDIGRVILNLINNAFYACAERSRSAVQERLRQAQPDSNYRPSVTVTTKRSNSRIEISVADNGNGIPEKIIDKIFNPFFTTKPTGQGTGLGLSLSYDIIKAHGGELKVETKEEEGSTFIIQLPTA